MNPTTPHLPSGCTEVREEPSRELPALVHPVWSERFPWLVQGTTVRGGGADPFDLGTFSDATPARAVMENWERLRAASRCLRVVHAHQIHGSAVRVHGGGAPGVLVSEPCDGHATMDAGTLLAVTVADCVPVSLVDPQRRAVALLHAGWRGTAAGILERGVAVLRERVGARPSEILAHLGPAICGRCYEVGAEVFRGLGLREPASHTPVDLRAVLAHRALGAGIRAANVSTSGHCTLCGEVGLFSHRRGDRARQAGFLGVRA